MKLEKNKVISVKFEYAGGESGLKHMLIIPVKISDRIETSFIFDTGIGVNLLSKELCEEVGCKVAGEIRGKRMTGQEIVIPMSEVPSLSISNFNKRDVPIANWDVRSMLPNLDEFNKVEGYLSLTYFRETPFTIDYKKKTFTIENEESLNERSLQGISVPLKISDEDGSLTVSVEMKTPVNETLLLQLDLGTDIMTLDNRFSKKLKLISDKADISTSTILDETGFLRERFFSKVDGIFSLGSTKEVNQTQPTVMFQNIIHDGIVGNDFFKDFVVTYDLSRSRIIISK